MTKNVRDSNSHYTGIGTTGTEFRSIPSYRGKKLKKTKTFCLWEEIQLGRIDMAAEQRDTSTVLIFDVDGTLTAPRQVLVLLSVGHFVLKYLPYIF